jgi:hypothetical protein
LGKDLNFKNLNKLFGGKQTNDLSCITPLLDTNDLSCITPLLDTLLLASMGKPPAICQDK